MANKITKFKLTDEGLKPVTKTKNPALNWADVKVTLCGKEITGITSVEHTPAPFVHFDDHLSL